MVKLTPKIQQLMQSEHIDTVNEMLDAGKSPNTVHKHLLSVGFTISAPMVYKYHEMRRAGLLNDVQAAPAETAAVIDDSGMRRRLLIEIEALDTLIEKGYEAIKELDPVEITPRLMMDAIRLKNELTGGNHAFLTEYGYASLKKLDDTRWRRVIEYMMSFISEEKLEEVQRGVAEIEENVYAGTPWQEEYLKAKMRSAANE